MLRTDSMGVSTDCAIFFGYTLYYLRNGRSYKLQILLHIYIHGVHPNKSYKHWAHRKVIFALARLSYKSEQTTVVWKC